MQELSIEGFQLSPQQKHLWLVQQNHHHLLHYRSQFSLLIAGQLDVNRLKLALGHSISRHEILRTAFQALPEMRVPLQVIAEANLPPIHYDDFSDLAAAVQAAKIEALWTSQHQPSFDFSQAPLWRVSLAKISSQQHLLLVCLPSLYADTVTLKLLIKELYEAYTGNTTEQNLTEPLQYADLAEWQNELFTSEEGALGRSYWRQQNLDACFNLKLPYENHQPESSQFAPQIHSIKIPANVVAKLDACTQQYKTASQTFLLVCWQVLLWKFTRQTSLSIGTRLDGRNYEELADALGLFAKYLPISCELQGHLPLTHIIQKVDQSLSSAAQWQESFTWEDIPYPNTETNKIPFFPVCFEFDPWPEQLTGHLVSFLPHQQYVCFDRFKVKLSCIRQGDTLTVEFHYDANLFLPRDIQHLADSFQILLASATATPEATLAQLNMVSDGDRHQLLHVLASSPHPYASLTTSSSAPKTHLGQTTLPAQVQGIHHLFATQAAEYPDRLALVCEDQQLTYAELNTRADQLAHYLKSIGVGPEVIIPIYLERSVELIIAMLAVLKTGGAYLPLDPTLPKAGLAYRLNLVQYPVLLTQQALVENLSAISPSLLCLDVALLPPPLPPSPHLLLTKSRLPNLHLRLHGATQGGHDRTSPIA
ncbi:MAG: AMP-binding protein [Cyanothece sp. SIO1E1]|nr:AMP-binding protein [Cyanothece sp. SIO1E1]